MRRSSSRVTPHVDGSSLNFVLVPTHAFFTIAANRWPSSSCVACACATKKKQQHSQLAHARQQKAGIATYRRRLNGTRRIRLVRQRQRQRSADRRTRSKRSERTQQLHLRVGAQRECEWCVQTRCTAQHRGAHQSTSSDIHRLQSRQRMLLLLCFVRQDDIQCVKRQPLNLVVCRSRDCRLLQSALRACC